MFYPAQFTPLDEGGYLITFRDIPEAITHGNDLTDAREMAVDALITSLDFYFEDRRAVPLPSPLQENEEWVALPASLYAKVLLLNEMLAQNVSNAELARRMSVRPQEIQRIVNLHHTTKIDTISSALLQLGKHLNIGLLTA